MRNSVIQILSIMSVLSVTVAVQTPCLHCPDYISVKGSARVPSWEQGSSFAVLEKSALRSKSAVGLQICLEWCSCVNADAPLDMSVAG